MIKWMLARWGRNVTVSFFTIVMFLISVIIIALAVMFPEITETVFNWVSKFCAGSIAIAIGLGVCYWVVDNSIPKRKDKEKNGAGEVKEEELGTIIR